MILAGVGGVYEVLLIILVIVLIFNGLKRQKIMNKVDANLSNQRPSNSASQKTQQPKVKEGEYIDFEETSE